VRLQNELYRLENTQLKRKVSSKREKNLLRQIATMTRDKEKAQKICNRQDQLKQGFQTTNESVYVTEVGAKIGRAAVISVKVCSVGKGLYLAEFDKIVEEMTHAEALRKDTAI